MLERESEYDSQRPEMCDSATRPGFTSPTGSAQRDVDGRNGASRLDREHALSRQADGVRQRRLGEPLRLPQLADAVRKAVSHAEPPSTAPAQVGRNGMVHT